jgi:hypothetical protein
MPTDLDSSLVSIFNRLNTLETHTASLNACYSTLHQHFDYVPTNSEPSSWYPTVKITIGGETFHARCDIMSEFCLMSKDVYESLSLWKLSEGGEEISLTNNATIFPVGIAEGVFTKVLGRMISTELKFEAKKGLIHYYAYTNVANTLCLVLYEGSFEV